MWTTSRKVKARAAARGFTLMELMVAMAAGVILSIAAFSFSRQATRAFANESRIASAQMSVLAGFQRLQSDVSRASYMASTNFNRDASVGKLCGYDLWPATLRTMALVGLRVTPEGSKGLNKTASLADKYPDSIRIVGNLATAEAYTVLSIQRGTGAGHDIYIRINDGPSSRSGFAGADGGDFNNVFLPGRMIRVLDMQGRQHYSVIESATWSSSGQPFISTTWPLALKGEMTAGAATQAVCGIDGFGSESQLNVVNIVDYGIANLSNASILEYNNTIYKVETGKEFENQARGDDVRTELVRRERLLNTDEVNLDQDANSRIAAEYAVDLRAALWTSNRTLAGCALGDTGLAFCDVNSAAIPALMTVGEWGTYSPGMTLTGPDSVRAVRLRLVTRSREIDRKADLGDPPNVPPMTHGEVFRYPIGTLGFARARTLVADVSLMNQRGDAWY